MFIDMLNLPNFKDFNLTSLYTGKNILCAVLCSGLKQKACNVR